MSDLRWGSQRATAFFAYAVIVAVALGEYSILWYRQYNYHLLVLQQQALDIKSAIDSIVRTSVDHVGLLRSQAQANLVDRRWSPVDNRLFVSLQRSTAVDGIPGVQQTRGPLAIRIRVRPSVTSSRRRSRPAVADKRREHSACSAVY